MHTDRSLAVKPARRITVQPWRDPRLVFGVLLVLAAMVIGAKAFAAQDNTQAFWTVRSNVAAGDRIDQNDLVQTRIHVPADLADHYFAVDDEFPADLDALVWVRKVERGALVERAAVVPADERTTAELPLNVADGAFPADLRRGDRVDVWVGPGQGQPAEKESVRVLHAVRVLSAGAEDDVIGGSTGRTVLVASGSQELQGTVVSQISSGHVTLVRVP